MRAYNKKHDKGSSRIKIPGRHERKKGDRPSHSINPFDINHMYKGRYDRWLVVALEEDVNVEDSYREIEKEILDIFGNDAIYFIPLYVEKLGDKEICLLLFGGYIFVKEPEEGFGNIDFSKMRTIYIKGAISKGNKYDYVKNKDINNFKKSLRKAIREKVPNIGQSIIPKEGLFKGIEGKVVAINKNRMLMTVIFETPSRVVEAPVSFINVQ